MLLVHSFSLSNCLYPSTRCFLSLFLYSNFINSFLIIASESRYHRSIPPSSLPCFPLLIPCLFRHTFLLLFYDIVAVASPSCQSLLELLPRSGLVYTLSWAYVLLFMPFSSFFLFQHFFLVSRVHFLPAFEHYLHYISRPRFFFISCLSSSARSYS